MYLEGMLERINCIVSNGCVVSIIALFIVMLLKIFTFREDARIRTYINKLIKIFLIIFIICLILFIFIPSGENNI